MMQLSISHHWFGSWLGARSVPSYYLNQWGPKSMPHICVTGPQWVKPNNMTRDISCKGNIPYLFCTSANLIKTTILLDVESSWVGTVFYTDVLLFFSTEKHSNLNCITGNVAICFSAMTVNVKFGIDMNIWIETKQRILIWKIVVFWECPHTILQNYASMLVLSISNRKFISQVTVDAKK